MEEHIVVLRDLAEKIAGAKAEADRTSQRLSALQAEFAEVAANVPPKYRAVETSTGHKVQYITPTKLKPTKELVPWLKANGHTECIATRVVEELDEDALEVAIREGSIDTKAVHAVKREG